MNQQQRDVRKFFEVYGHQIGSLAAPGIPASEEEMKLRIRLIEEEFHEFRDACMENDIVKAADALGDLLYVVNGAGISFGLDLEPVFEEIQDSNMTKLGLDGKPIYRADGKVQKGPNYRPPDVAKIIRQQIESELGKRAK